MSLDAYALGATAQAFTTARQNDKKMSSYPGTPPSSLEEAYAIQDSAILLWPESIAGWKVGGIDNAFAEQYGVQKLVGPIFKNQVFNNGKDVIEMPVFQHGFAAIEAEIVLTLKEDAPKTKTNWTLNEAKAMVGSAHIGVEIASSPFAQINAMGPLVTISDFGNNYGLIIGDKLPNWAHFDTKDWIVETIIETESMGVKSSAQAGGPLESLRYCLENTAKRGRPLLKGMAISTGAITGVHQAHIGQHSTVRCIGAADIHLRLVTI